MAAENIVAGLDEAGRGPVLGSLCIGCVLMKESELHVLEELGVDDSKKLTPKKREEIAEKIKAHALAWKVIELTAEDLNKLHEAGFTLNKIEEMRFGMLLNEMTPQPDIIYLDAADVYEERFGRSVRSHLKFTPKEIISKHRGDAIFPIVGAASILAKVQRDRIIQKLKEQYGEIGSGYPSDPYTRKFLKEYYRSHRSFPPIVRTFWKTVEKIKDEVIREEGWEIEVKNKSSSRKGRVQSSLKKFSR